MQRFSVIVFQTVGALWSEHAEEKGGGVLFVPIDARENWPRLLDELVAKHFRHTLGHAIELGIANLDENLLRRHCHRHRDGYWQGGDGD